jgi:hypothetical protein
VTYDVLVVLAHAGWRVPVAGITSHPAAPFMPQCARPLTDSFDGFLRGKWYLIHDRNTKCTPAFDGLLTASGVEPLLWPSRSSLLNADCARFVPSIKEEALARMIRLGECALSDAIQQYLAHDHTERNHRGLTHRLSAPQGAVGGPRGHVVRREHLGRLLSYDYREAT